MSALEATLLASETLLPSVGEHVTLQVLSCFTFVAALTAAEGLHFTVDEHVVF